MKREFLKTGKLATSHQGVSLMEILIVLAISGVLAVMTIPMLLNQNKSKAWVRVAEDYFDHLSSVHRTIFLKHGSTPMLAEDTDGDPLYPDGVGSFLEDWETAATYDDSPTRKLEYPSGIVVYLDPHNSNVPDPSNQISNTTVMAGTNNKEWLLLDLNGDDAPNSIASTGDRVLIRIEDATGRILTAYQACFEPASNCTEAFPKSFYDTAKGYDYP